LSDRQRSDERIMVSPIFARTGERRARNGEGSWVEPSRALPVYHRCDVLVVGGGPAGTAAAVAAAREGADVTLLERYNHLGGLSTGGLVIWIDRMTDAMRETMPPFRLNQKGGLLMGEGIGACVPWLAPPLVPDPAEPEAPVESGAAASA